MARFATILAAILAPLAAAAPLNVAGGSTDVVTAPVPGKMVISNFNAKNIIPNRFIVVYNNTFDDEAISKSQALFTAAVKKRNLGKRSFTGHLLSTEVKSYALNTWRAMCLDADDDMIAEISSSPEVAYVEADTIVRLSQGQALAQTNAPAGLERLSHAAAGESNYIFDVSSGEGITAYVVDTGVKTTHVEFEGRATFGANFVNNVVSIETTPWKTTLANAVSRMTMRTATAVTSPVPLAVPPLVLPRRSALSASRSSTRTVPVPTLASSTACSSSSTTSRRRTSRARLL
jgi:subtilisin family serine protease